jgi:hypothetical protein
LTRRSRSGGHTDPPLVSLSASSDLFRPIDVLPDNHPNVDPAALYLQITALREAEPALA